MPGNGKTFEMLTKLRQLRTHICACLCIFSFSQFTVAATATRRPYVLVFVSVCGVSECGQNANCKTIAFWLLCC